MRLFAAVDLAPSVRRAAADATRRLANAVAGSGARGRPRVSWVREENLHLTMRFLGEVEDSRIGDLATRFIAPLDGGTFDIEISGVGVFPPVGPSRVIWLGVTRGSERLAALAAQIDERFLRWGFGREDRPFRAHLTVGRCREALDRAARDRILAAAVASLGSSRVDQVVLYESRLAPGGPTYVALARAPLVP
jgi:2'-5' RNA ligase